jgi:hypothetical protein
VADSLAHSRASSAVFAISAKMHKDLPMPISSARTPPPVSSRGVRDRIPVIVWEYLRAISHTVMWIYKTCPTRFVPLFEFLSKEKTLWEWDQFLVAS